MRDFIRFWPRESRLAWLLAFLLAALTLALFWPARGYQFIDLDDALYVTANSHVISGLHWENVRWAMTTVHEGWWLPMLWLSYMLDATLSGTYPAGYHLVNILLHAANTLLLFWVLRRSTGRLWESAFVAALFALHPLRVESVAWVAQRKDVLSGFFWMLAMAAHVAQVRRPSVFRQGLVFLCMLLGLMSKATVVSLPFALLLMDFWPLRRLEIPGGWRRCLAEKIPLFLLAAAFAALTLRNHIAAGGASSSLSPWERLALIPGNYLLYLAKFLWPTRLSVYYPEHDVVRWLPALGMTLVLSAATFAMWHVRRAAPYLLMGWLWFGLVLGPMIRGVRVGLAMIADRFLYLPAIGLGILAAWGFSAWLAPRPRGRWGLGLLAAAVLAACGSATAYNLRFWRDSDTLFTRVWELDPDNYLGITGRGVALQRQERWEEARQHFARAVDQAPDVVRYRVFLALALVNMNRLPEAFALLEQGFQLKPDELEYHYALGLAYLQDNNPQQAVVQLARAVELSTHPPSYYLVELARALFEAGDSATANAVLVRAWNKTPPAPYTYTDLLPHYAWVWESGERPRALQYLRNLAQRESGNAVVLNNLAWFLAVAERAPAPPEEPLALARRALELAGENPPLVMLDTLAAAQANAGEYGAAVKTSEQAIRLAREQDLGGFARRLENRLAKYRAGKPWRESVMP